MADSPSAGGKTSPGPAAGAYGPNEYERFGKGRTPDQYKEEELANVDQLKHESDAELERKRKRVVYLALMFEARALGNPHGLTKQFGPDEPMPDILNVITENCDRNAALSTDRCKAVYGELAC